MLLLFMMALKLGFKTEFRYGFSDFFIDNRLVNRAGTASLDPFLLCRNTRLASISLSSGHSLLWLYREKLIEWT